MKKIFFVLSLFASINSFEQTTNESTSVPVSKLIGRDVPAEVLTGDGVYWTISTVATVGYVNTTPGSNYNSYKSGGGMIVKFKFLPGSRFQFLLYVQANTYGTDTETWTQVEGKVVFTRDEKGQQVFITQADKGTYRITKNGITNSRTIPVTELEGQHSNRYLWEKTNFPDDPKNTYLLLVDLDAHPGADINIPGTIQPDWVSKFHVPKNN